MLWIGRRVDAVGIERSAVGTAAWGRALRNEGSAFGVVVTAGWLQARRAGTCGWRSSGWRARSTCTGASCAGRWWRTSATTITCTSRGGSSARCAAPRTRAPTTCGRTASSSTPRTTPTRASSRRPRRPRPRRRTRRCSPTTWTRASIDCPCTGSASTLCERAAAASRLSLLMCQNFNRPSRVETASYLGLSWSAIT